MLGRTLDPQLLPKITSLPPENIAAALHSAFKLNLLGKDTVDGRQFRFRSAVMHEAVIQAIPSWQAATMHSRVADVLSAVEPPAPAQTRVKHLLAAGRSFEAAPLCLLAAEDASRAGAFTEAAALYKSALPSVGDLTERGELLCERGRMLLASGGVIDAASALDEGVRLLQQSESTSIPYHLVTLGDVHRHTGDRGSALHAYQLGLRCLEGESPTPELAMLHARLAMWHNADLDCETGLTFAE